MITHQTKMKPSEIEFLLKCIERNKLSAKDFLNITGYMPSLILAWKGGQEVCYNSCPYKKMKEFEDKLNDSFSFMTLLRKFMSENNHTISSIAELINVHPTTVKNWFYGKTEPNCANYDIFNNLYF